ncbi:hypothetical protein [Rhizobium tubonense]|uniref:Mlr2029 protein n=1 Tax=Rhizobium tubonense TaxID=484088 RepID=A0A2W4CQ89_9HYPH|nr:hypothetical protein [Rhizobium tubonense]PZM14897.1 hypothetical protein CPY51_09400 [Rhizobium tubonense]
MLTPKKNDAAELIEAWTLPPAATLGSFIRSKGILLEIRARLPFALRKSLDISGRVLTLTMPEGSEDKFRATSDFVAKSLDGIENLPVIPREIEDILTISTTERHRWLNDGRLPSAGTRTVKLRGRARKITFHVFDPRLVEDLLDRGVVEDWREEDAATAAENRRRAAWKAKLTRSLKKGGKTSSVSKNRPDEDNNPDLPGWEEFRRDGLLR